MGFLFREDLYVGYGDMKQYEIFITCFMTGKEFTMDVRDYGYYVSIYIKSWELDTYDKLEVIPTPERFMLFRTGIKEVINKIRTYSFNLTYSNTSGIIDRLPEYKKEVIFQEHFNK